MAVIKDNIAVTLVELIMVMVLIGIISVTAAVFFIPMVNLFFYLPSQLMVEQTAQTVIDIIIEGDREADGLRYTTSISSADEDEITFTTSGGDMVNYRWDATEQRIYRNINSQGENLIPYSYYGDIIVKGASSDSEIFQYYDSPASKISPPVSSLNSIESIRINLIIQAGQGNIKANQGKIEINTGVDIKQFKDVP